MAKDLATKIEDWLKNQIEERGARGFVLGLSGGIDSAVAAALCRNVCPTTTIGVAMPCYSEPEDLEHARLVAQAFGLDYREVVLDDVFSLLVKLLTGQDYAGQKDMALANLKPRLRMTVMYYYAARHQCLVVGTTNKSEYTVGYFTKHGDGGVDLMPLVNIVKKDIWKLAEYLGVPDPIIQKPPSAGLWPGQNDEHEMGLTYTELDGYILTGKADERVRNIVNDLAAKSLHKKQLPAVPPW